MREGTGGARFPQAAAAMAAALLLLAAPAAAGNRHSYSIGGRGAMMAGAFTAVADDASASWYNPGGLGFHRRSSFEISANAFSLSCLRIEDLLAVKTEAEELDADFSSIDLFVIPTSFVYVLSLTPGDAAHPVNFAFSVFVPEAQRFGDTMGVKLEKEYPDEGLDLEVVERLDFNVDTQQYLLGPSLGFNVNEHLGVGLSIYGLYATSSSDADYYFDVYERNSQTESFAVGTYKFDATHVGIGFTAGMLARIRDTLNIGLHFRSPTFKIYSDAKVTALEGSAVDEVGIYLGSSMSF